MSLFLCAQDSCSCMEMCLWCVCQQMMHTALCPRPYTQGLALHKTSLPCSKTHKTAHGASNWCVYESNACGSRKLISFVIMTMMLFVLLLLL